MDQELNQIVQAILVASDPAQTSLHQQALEYLSTIQQNARMTWRWALAIFVEGGPEIGARKYPPQARFFALRVLDDFLDDGFGQIDPESFKTIQESLLGYIRSEYVFGSAEINSSFLRNKFSHTLTLLFLRTYVEQWPTFFSDLFALISPTESSSQSTFNPHLSLLFFHMILEISGEVADQILKAARQHNPSRHARDAGVRDAIRERDAAQINEAVLTIVAANVDKMARLRAEDDSSDSRRDLEMAEELVDWGVRTFGSYVGWVDINLTVTATTVPLLFGLLSDPSLPIRLATCVALSRIVSKGLKEASDKLRLIKVLSLGDVLAASEATTREQQIARGVDIDEGEESYREALGKLLNALGLELVKLSEDVQDDVRAEAVRLLDQVLPIMLRFLADDYDDTSSTVFTLLQTILAGRKKARKLTSDPVDDSTRSFLTSLLTVLLDKLKWDADADMDDIDEDDKTAFEVLRKDLRSFMDSVLVIDPTLVTEAVQTLAMNTLNAYQSGVPVKWNDAELAVYLVWIFGEINKSGGGKGRSSFCHAPAIDKDKRKFTDYSEFPLTAHGEMLYTLIQSGISTYPHPTVSIQFFETVCRYIDFFKVRKECIMPTLHVMIDKHGLHNPNLSVRARVFYLFHRFIREARNEISPELAGTLLESIRDLLPIEVDIPELENPEQDMLTEAIKNPGLFDSQLYLYETAGVLISSFWRDAEQSASLLLSVVKPLMNDLSVNLQAAKASHDFLPILKVHHAIMALGNIAKGFPDFPSPIPEGYILPPLDVFREIAQSILMSLESLHAVQGVRDATRSAFARILSPTGNSTTYLIPPLMVNLLVHSDPSELADFMNFIGLLIHRLRDDMFSVVDELISPLTSHVSQLLSQPATGTDDAVSHVDTKKAFLGLLNNIMSAKLQGVFLSQRNKGQIEDLLGTMERLIEDISDPSSEKSALQFLGRCVTSWGNPEATSPTTAGQSERENSSLPGFERFIYERLIPATFRVLSLPGFSVKDGQLLTVSYEIATFYQNVAKVRGQETLDFFYSVFLPSQNWPPEMALDFTTKLRDLDNKAFKKYFTDIVRASRDGS